MDGWTLSVENSWLRRFLAEDGGFHAFTPPGTDGAAGTWDMMRSKSSQFPRAARSWTVRPGSGGDGGALRWLRVES